MAAIVMTERHLWLNLTGIEERNKAFLLDAPISPSGLFGDAINNVVNRYNEVKQQWVAFKELVPHHMQEPVASTSHSRPRPSSRRDSVVACAPS